jgi:hypothetical protein
MAVKKRLVRETEKVYMHKKDSTIGVAWYKPEQWELLKKLSQDGDELENTFTEWIEFVQKKVRELRKMGIKVEKVKVDVKELLAWCNERSLPINGESRAAFVASKTTKPIN